MTVAAYGAAPFADSHSGVLASAVGWIAGTVTGTVAAVLCILAIAAIGLMMLAGRLPVRNGLRVVLGCFVLLGAPAIAAALMGLGHSAGGSAPVVAPAGPPPATRALSAPAAYPVAPRADETGPAAVR